MQGASEHLLLPDMIEKCAKAGDFDSQAYKLPVQGLLFLRSLSAFDF